MATSLLAILALKSMLFYFLSDLKHAQSAAKHPISSSLYSGAPR
jgi:hypothetical protein